MRNICFTDTSHLVLLDILFVLKVKLGTFCQFTVVHFHLISNIFLCRYASRTLRMKLLTWCRVMSGRAFRVGRGSGLSLSKYFGPAYKTFYNIKSNDFLLSWGRFLLLTAVTSVSEVIVIFLQLICLQTQLRSFILCWDWSHTAFEKATAVRKLAHDGVVSKRSITFAILGLF